MVKYSRGDIMEDIEARLKLLREKRRLTQKELAEKQIAVPKMLKEPRKSKKNNVCKNICNNDLSNPTQFIVQLANQLMSRKSPV